MFAELLRDPWFLAALAALVIGWGAVSFSEPGRSRAVLEWLSATAMYVVLLMLFLRLSQRAWEGGSYLALAAFGFLSVVFTIGCGVSVVKAFQARRREEKSQVSATN
ncbi:MAG: hypothetical protein V3U03_00950 [Myxococcota bacterium]